MPHITVDSMVLPSSKTSAPALPSPQRVQSSFQVFLTPWSFCLCWWAILVSHMVVGGYAMSVATLNRYLQQEIIIVSLSSLQVPADMLSLTEQSFLVVAICHTIAIVRMLWASVKSRQLAFQSVRRPALLSGPAISTSTRKVNVPAAQRNWTRHTSHFISAVTAQWGKVFGTNGCFGLNGKNFETLFTFRESLEIMMQTYQAYNLSLSVPRPWINQLAVAAIALNCLASPVVHVVFRHNDRYRRVVNLVHDAILDFISAVVIPVAIVYPYMLVFDPSIQNFPQELVMDDVWFVNAISELRQALVTSLPDYISTILPQLSLLGCLMTLNNVLCHRSSSVGHEWLVATTAPTIEAIKNAEEEAQHEHQSLTQVMPTMASRQTRMTQDSVSTVAGPAMGTGWTSHGNRRRVVLDVLFIVWGLTVLGLHLHARHVTQDEVPGCRLYVAAWYATGLACSVMNLNCHMQQIQGSTNETTAILNELDRWTLQILVFSHCPALQVPPVAIEFFQVVGMELFNCSLVEWPLEAALRQETQPRIGYLVLVLTNWTTFPEGILHDQLPTSLKQFFILGNNMSELPESIGEVWGRRPWTTLGVSNVPQLQLLPSSFCELTAAWVALANTGIETFPEDCFPRAKVLVVSGSPVRALPATVAFDPASLVLFEAENTNITELPPWLELWLHAQPIENPFGASMYGSPVCTNSSDWDTFCKTEYDSTYNLYPWEDMLPQRQFEEKPHMTL